MLLIASVKKKKWNFIILKTKVKFLKRNWILKISISDLHVVVSAFPNNFEENLWTRRVVKKVICENVVSLVL